MKKYSLILFVLLLPVVVLSQEFDYKKAATDIVSERFSNFTVKVEEMPTKPYIDNFKREYRVVHILTINVCTKLTKNEINHNTLDNINYVSNDIYQYFFDKFADEKPPEWVNKQNYYFSLEVLIMLPFNNNCSTSKSGETTWEQSLYLTSEDNVHFNRGVKQILYENEIFTQQ